MSLADASSARSRPLGSLGPPGQAAVSRYVESTKAGIRVYVPKNELAFYRRPSNRKSRKRGVTMKRFIDHGRSGVYVWCVGCLRAADSAARARSSRRAARFGPATAPSSIGQYGLWLEYIVLTARDVNCVRSRSRSRRMSRGRGFWPDRIWCVLRRPSTGRFPCPIPAVGRAKGGTGLSSGCLRFPRPSVVRTSIVPSTVGRSPPLRRRRKRGSIRRPMRSPRRANLTTASAPTPILR